MEDPFPPVSASASIWRRVILSGYAVQKIKESGPTQTVHLLLDGDDYLPVYGGEAVT
jgi:hypothetical protein